MYLNSKNNLGQLFPKAMVQWTPAQKAMAGWLHYYDQYYERSAGEDNIESWMVEYPELVDSFFVWYDRKMEAEREESNPSTQPKASDHKEIYLPRHR